MGILDKDEEQDCSYSVLSKLYHINTTIYFISASIYLSIYKFYPNSVSIVYTPPDYSPPPQLCVLTHDFSPHHTPPKPNTI